MIETRLIARARRAPRRIALPESADPRIIEAAVRLRHEGIAEPILVGDREACLDAARESGHRVDRIEIVDPADSDRTEAYAGILLERGQAKGRTREESLALVSDPLYFADIMVRAGDADGAVAGAVHTTAETLRAAIACIGPAPGVRHVSTFFVMEIPAAGAGRSAPRAFIFADCGLIPEPDEHDLVEIAIASAASAQMILQEEPRIAFLSFSTRGSADHPAAQKVARAARALKERRPDIVSDGELQVDAAIVPAVADRKAPGSPVAGEANVLIFPSLEAGNIAYKLTERLAGATALGPVAQGLDRPANDLSRGCSALDVVLVVAITSLQAGRKAA